MKPLACWRLVRTERAATAFDGEGARRHGGRWNPPGLPAVYASGSRALAALEVAVHIAAEARTWEFILFRVELDPAWVADLRPGEPPGSWWRFPPPESSRALGATFLEAGGRHVALRVPSVIVPEESNFLLNPRHPDFPQAAITRERAFFLDPRLR